MNPNDRMLWIDLMTSRYLTAFETDDFGIQASLWKLAESDAELAQALHEIHLGLIEELEADGTAAVKHAVAAAMPGARIDRSAEGPVTMAEVADELARTAGPKLKADGYAFLESFTKSEEALPANLGQSQFAAWAEQRFPGAPAGFWPLFHKSSLKVERRRESQDQYSLAARRSPLPAPPPEEDES